MNTSLSLESILQMLSGLSLSNRKWLAEHLVEPAELERAKQRKSDEEWLREFQALPRGNDKLHSGTDPIVHFLSDVTDDAKADTC